MRGHLISVQIVMLATALGAVASAVGAPAWFWVLYLLVLLTAALGCVWWEVKRRRQRRRHPRPAASGPSGTGQAASASAELSSTEGRESALGLPHERRLQPGSPWRTVLGCAIALVIAGVIAIIVLNIIVAGGMVPVDGMR